MLSPSTLREERESVRDRLLRDRPVKVGGMGEESRDRMIRIEYSFSDISRERYNTHVDVKRQMERKEDFEILESPLAEKQEGMGQAQSRRAGHGR